MLRSDPRSDAGPRPVVGVVGPIQLDILAHRLAHEYGVAARIDRLPHIAARWISGPAEALGRAGRIVGCLILYDRHDRPVLLFESSWTLRRTPETDPDLVLSEIEP